MSKSINVPKLRFKEFNGEWEEKQLGKIATFYNSKRIPLTEIDRIKGEYPYYGASGIIDYVKDYIFDGEYILLGEDGANIVMRNSRLAFLAKGKFWVNNHAHIFQAKDSNTFLCEALERINYTKYNTGTAQPKLNSDVVKKIKLLVPLKQEQEKIASFLTSIDTKIEQLTKKEELLKQYKKGVMQKIFNQEIRFKADDGNEFYEWEEKKLGDLGTVITGKTPSNSNSEFWNGKIEFITPTDIEGSKYQTKTTRTVTQQSNMKILPIGTIVYTCIASIGKMSLSTLPSITNQQINSLIVNDKKYNNEFVYYALLKITPYIQSTQANTTLPIINKTEFSKFIINVPCIEEQTKIANFLSSIDKKIELTTKELNSTKEFKKALLQQMFV
ncbi:restriction endonuclease subunit S [Aliarcobacter butzleri]|uniref:restriction endonuclease subunit S n=2 Tax=Aliarcobacter butzleri TaxID=28197 RepID=UPI0021B65174|nr:restriction endonuclease subunit S [Aliarcobacter butzleri]MCT7574589.1 restriction endonuclease subunit S [Aliarcobacter butzleri]